MVANFYDTKSVKFCKGLAMTGILHYKYMYSAQRCQTAAKKLTLRYWVS